MARLNLHFWLGLALMAVLTLLFWVTNLDLHVQALAYSATPPHWPRENLAPWSWLYHYGEIPGNLLGLGSLAALIASYYTPAWKKWRPWWLAAGFTGLGAFIVSLLFAGNDFCFKARFPGLFLALCAAALWAAPGNQGALPSWRRPCLFLLAIYALGPGLIINGITKGMMGRPRPHEILQFGGAESFVRPFAIGTPFKGRSLISGHCSMAYIFFGLFFLLKGWKRWTSLAFTLVFGILMSVTRVVQGAHFLSDTVLCGALLYTLSAALSPLAATSRE